MKQETDQNKLIFALVSKVRKGFCGKILLFGEYSVLLNSKALSLPFGKYTGELQFALTNSSFSDRSNEELREFVQYLKAISSDINGILNLTQLEIDINQGLYFHSSIPQSYGIGSSGALCAAIFSKYSFKNSELNSNLVSLKNMLGTIESGFHGKSSGLDPLVSYLNQAVLVSGKNQVDPIDLKENSFLRKGEIFLIDSEQKGDTEPLVANFLKQCENANYKSNIIRYLNPKVNDCIHSFCDNKINSFYNSIKQISDFQITNFKDKIPSKFLELWRFGIESDQFYLKLCGSGGGGFLLGFTKYPTETHSFLLKNGFNYQVLNFS